MRYTYGTLGGKLVGMCALLFIATVVKGEKSKLLILGEQIFLMTIFQFVHMPLHHINNFGHTIV